jgi:hypothetical protein
VAWNVRMITEKMNWKECVKKVWAVWFEDLLRTCSKKMKKTRSRLSGWMASPTHEAGTLSTRPRSSVRDWPLR